MTIGANTRLVEGNGLATRPFWMFLQTISSSSSMSLESRVSALETDVASLQTDVTTLEALAVVQAGQISALQTDVTTNTASIAALDSRLDDEEIRSIWVTPWP